MAKAVMMGEVGEGALDDRIRDGFRMIDDEGEGDDILLDPVLGEVRLTNDATGSPGDSSRRSGCSKRCLPAE